MRKISKGILPKECLIVFLGNRLDEEEEREVGREEAEAYCRGFGILFFEVSGKFDREKINKVFRDCVVRLKGMQGILKSFKELPEGRGDGKGKGKGENCGGRCRIF